MTRTTPRNPWTWQEALGFSQAIEVSDARRALFCSGQTSVDADGNPVHAGDMAAQVTQALDNLEAVLAQAGLGFEHVVRLNYYTTDVAALMAVFHMFGERMKASCPPAGTLLGVQGLFHPDILIEIEATAVA